ncbi:MAG: helix-turn-helix transcriptional regulator [Oscillospiraceae bacterium]|jgi:putative transcriptional regulator|nr:helix-turn-helix transcriptional regulator [Oscillospiraceae bacterium]
MDSGIFVLKNYGKVIITFREAMEMRGFNRNKVAKMTGLSYNTINRYYQGDGISGVDLDVVAKICYVLQCEVGDLLKNERPAD